MAKKRRRKTASRPRSRSRRPAPPAPREPLVSPETTAAIVGVLSVLFGIVLLLAVFGFGGPLGKALSEWVAQVLGWASWILPFLLLWYGYRLYAGVLTRRQVVGTLLVLLSIGAIFSLTDRTGSLDAALRGDYGGIVGYGLSHTVIYALGTFGSVLLFMAGAVIGVFITLDRSFRKQPAAVPATAEPTPAAPRPVSSPASAPKRRETTPEPDFQPRMVDSTWEQPPLTLLSAASSTAAAGDTDHAAKLIEQTLGNFNVIATIENVNVGPSVTQYELRPDAGVKLNQITALGNDLALALAAHPIRIEAPIPGKSTVGIEVPNAKPAVVRLRQLFATEEWKNGGALPMALGQDVSGKSIVGDLANMPHLLIAGATGAGKSVGINTILMSLLYTHSPKHLRLLLVDPKRVELTAYNDIPHLITPVIVEAPKVVNALKWVVSEMDRRYRLFQENKVKNLSEFNAAHADQTLPYLVVVIDELADLMQVSGKAVEATVVRIAQLARATGIHLILATQRPSVDVITGLIKANFPSRIAFTVTSAVDSRTILDTGGAEKLLGRGDMLYMPGNVAKPVRVQGAFVDNSEVKKLTDFLKGKGEPSYEEDVTEKQSSGGLAGGSDEADDPLYDEAKAEVLRSRKASASLLQRRLKVGYARAARLLDMLEENGVIGPGDGAKPREILMDSDDLV